MSVAKISPRASAPLSSSIAGYRGAIVASQTPPLPASSVEYWHGELGASAASAVGQIAGITLPANGAPTVGPDGAFFNGRNVYKSTTSGSAYWRGAALASGIPSGAKPWVYAIGRWRSVPGGADKCLVGLDRSGASAECDLRVDSTGNRNTFSTSGYCVATNGVGDTNVHRIWAWANASAPFNVGNLTVDDVNATGTSTTTGVSGSITGISIGGHGGSVYGVSDASVAFYLICLTTPSAGEISALNAWAQSYWGAP